MTLLLLLLAALIQVRGQPLNGGSLSGSVELPLERAAGGDTPVLPFRTARGPLRLLLDTGATSTMVTPQLARRLGLTSSVLPPTAFALAGGGERCDALRPQRTRLPDLDLATAPGAGSLRLRGVEALVLPVAALPDGVDGVLGAPTLRQQPIWVDPQANRLAFGAAALRLAAVAGRVGRPTRMASPQFSPAGSLLGAPGPQRLRLRWQKGVPLVELGTPAGVVTALADTGAEGLFVSGELARRLPLQGRPRVLRLVGFCGEQPVEQYGVAGLVLSGGGAAMPAPVSHASNPAHEVIITANPLFAALGVEAIVGQELLRQRRQLWRLDLEPPQLLLD